MRDDQRKRTIGRRAGPALRIGFTNNDCPYQRLTGIPVEHTATHQLPIQHGNSWLLKWSGGRLVG